MTAGTPARAAAAEVVPPNRRVGHAVADDVGQPEGDRQLTRPVFDRRLVVERERLERLDHVAPMQVEERVGRGDQTLEDGVGEHVICAIAASVCCAFTARITRSRRSGKSSGNAAGTTR